MCYYFFLSVISQIYQSIFLFCFTCRVIVMASSLGMRRLRNPSSSGTPFRQLLPSLLSETPPCQPSHQPFALTYLHQLSFLPSHFYPPLFFFFFLSFLCFFFPLHVFAFHLFFAPNSSPLHTKEGSGSSMFFIQSREVMPHHA